MSQHREPARLVVAALVLLLAACSRRQAAAPPTPAPPPGDTAAAGGCGRTASYQGAIPAWLVDATGNNAPGVWGLVLTGTGIVNTSPAGAAVHPALKHRANSTKPAQAGCQWELPSGMADSAGRGSLAHERSLVAAGRSD